jgi:Lon protease-like protein
VEPQTIPLFPLANVVLLPRLDVPLYIFEARYRQMVEHALDGVGVIGMMAVPPEYVADMEGDPPLFEFGCAGRIHRSKRRPDGTFEILLTGTGRFRILEEVVRPLDRLYRVGRVTALDGSLDQPAGDSARGEASEDDRLALRAARFGLLEHLQSLLRSASADGTAQTFHTRFEAMDDEQFVNALSLGLDFSVADKQRLLEAPRPIDRYELLCEWIRFRVAELQHRGNTKSELVH